MAGAGDVSDTHPSAEWRYRPQSEAANAAVAGSQTYFTSAICGRAMRSRLKDGASPLLRDDTVPACTINPECPAMR